MDVTQIASFFVIGLGLGMIHAFDLDHLAALCAASASDKNTKTQYWGYAVRWSLGHGSALAIIAAAVLLIGMAMPVKMSELSEHSVAYLLIGFGIFSLIRMRSFNNKDDFDGAAGNRIGQHGTTALGVIHGLAGSAPLLALIPLSQLNSPVTGVVYVLFFSAGVTLSMVGLASVFGAGLAHLSQKRQTLRLWAQLCLALFSIVVGGFLLF